ncbi:MAG: serine hydrolase [Blastocatellia bacterium]|nr:serine hydrolase [Blastocatellia bacterium]
MRLFFYVPILAIAIAIAGCGVSAQTKTIVAGSKAYRHAADYSREARGLSVLVIKGEKIVFEEYHNGHSENTPWMLASGTKSFSGVILAAAIEDKLISDFDEPVSKTLTEWRSDARLSKVTYRQLLTLTSGIDVGQNARPPAYSAAVMFKSRFEPGDRFQYGPVPFQAFGEAMRRKLSVKKESVMDYLERRIFEPIGLKVGRWTMQEGQPNMPSGAFLTAREWAKFGQFLKNGGRWNGKQVVSAKLLAELTNGSKANPNYGLTFWLNRSNSGRADVAENEGRLRQILGDRPSNTTEMSRRGFGPDVPSDAYMAAGAGNQRLYIIPSLDLIIVRQGRLTQFDDREFLLRMLGKDTVPGANGSK